MRRGGRALTERYGAWAVVAGASEGIGAAFAGCLAERGLNLLLIARRGPLLEDVARHIRERHDIEVRCLAMDLADPTLGDKLVETTAGLDLGVLIYNAAFVPTGRFLELGREALDQVARVNVCGPLALLHTLLPPLCARGRGAVVLMSSLAGFQGTPNIAAYAATKAFNTILAEGLWAELREQGIDVVACCAGATRTPGYERTFGREVPGMLTPEAAARQTLDALGKGPRVVTGWVNRVSAQVINRLLTRRAAIRLIASNTRDVR